METQNPDRETGRSGKRADNESRAKSKNRMFARRFLFNLSYLAAGDLAAKALAFWAFAHIARVVGTELFGDIGFAVAVSLYFRLIVSQGLDVYGIQDVARDRSLVLTHSAKILGLRLMASLVAVAALVICVPLIGKAPHIKALLLLYGLGLLLSAFSLQWVFQAIEQMKVVAVANVLGQLVFSVLALLLLNRPAQFLWIPILQIAGEVVSTLYLLVLFRRHFGTIRISFGWRAWPGILRNSLPMGLTNVLSLIMFNFDLVLLGFLKPASDVGQYSAAYKVIGFFSSFVLLYNRNLLPAVSRCKDDPLMLRQISQRTQKYVLLLAVPLAVGGALLSRPLIELIFGSQFRGSAAALAILIWIIPISSSRVLYRVTLLSHGFQNSNLWLSLAAVTVNVSLNVLLIPRFSYVGSAFASLSAEMLLLVLTFGCVARKVTHLPLTNQLWKPMLASIAMAVFVNWSGAAGVVVRMLGGFFVYVIAALTLRAFDIREIQDLIGWKENQDRFSASDAAQGSSKV